jgi:tetratricopeptide (TPR) repeat protein
MKGTDAMRYALSALSISLLLAASALAARPAARVAAPAAGNAPAANVATTDQDEMPRLLSRLNELSEFIGQNMQSPQLWRYQLAQGEVLLQIAARCKPEECDGWLRMAVDSYQSAAVMSPDNDITAHSRLVQIVSTYPQSPISTYAVLQDIRADYMRALDKAGDKPALAQKQLRDRLILFAQQFPTAPEAPLAALEVGQISEALGQMDDARRYYRYLAEHCPDRAVARKAGTALWHLGLAGEPMQLKLPFLFAAGNRSDQAFDFGELHDKVAVVYFWSSTSPQAEDDFRTLKELTDSYQDRGLQVIYVNMENDPARAKAFLSGRLTAGVHVFQPGGLESRLAERYGIQTLPQAFLIGKDGILVRHALQASQLDAEISGDLARAR